MSSTNDRRLTTSSSERLSTIDALRGFALLGILLVHFHFWYSAGPLPAGILSGFQDTGSKIAEFITGKLLTGKFFGIFSFLFGLSFFLQMQSSFNKKTSFVKKYSWRLILLLIIGCIHHEFWMGDILAIYAILGFILLAMRGVSDRVVLIIGLFCAMNFCARLLIVSMHFLQDNNTQVTGDHPDALYYYNTITKGDLLDNFKFNYHILSEKIYYQLFGGRLMMTLGFFLLGMYAGRKKWFQNSTDLSIFKKLFKITSIGILVYLLIIFGFHIIDQKIETDLNSNRNFLFASGIINDIFNVFAVAFYISAFALLFQKKTWNKILNPLSFVGKMALTSYLSQTLFGLLLFYNLGFGLFGKTSPGLNMLIAVGIFIIQVIFSKWWFRHFNYGIVEWLWRSATLWKWQQLRKNPN